MSYINNWEKNGLYRVFENTTSGEEVLSSNFAIQGDPRFDEIRYVINHFTNITDFVVTDSDISKIAIFDNVASISNPHLKIAIVTTYEPLLVFINKYCEQMHDSTFECKIFGNVDDACKWASESENK